MLGKLKDLTMNSDGSQNLTITVQADFREEYDLLAEKDVDVTIKKASLRRSLDANAFLWHLCSEIAARTAKYSKAGKEDIYREAIRAKGVYEPLVIRKDAVDRFVNRWSDKGAGWFTDVIDDYKGDYKVVHAYYGSSTYTAAEISRIVDYVVMQAEELGIPTITTKEMERLLGRWSIKQETRNVA